MPRRVFNFDRPDRFICGALGEPGRRTFYIQAAKGAQVVSVALEKAQVALLAERLATLLVALRNGGVAIGEEDPAATQPLREPVVEQFRVGTLTIGWDGAASQVVIEARQLGDDDFDDDEEAEADQAEVAKEAAEAAEVASVDATDDPRDVVRVQLEPRAALDFASGALEVVRAGRPPCPQCGAPLEASGHFCVRRNGYTN